MAIANVDPRADEVMQHIEFLRLQILHEPRPDAAAALLRELHLQRRAFAQMLRDAVKCA